MDKYLSEPLIPFHSNNSFSQWNDNKDRLPHLAELARKYFSAPPTSVPSERLFSGVGEIYDDKAIVLLQKEQKLYFVLKKFHFFVLNLIFASYIIVHLFIYYYVLIMCEISFHQN